MSETLQDKLRAMAEECVAGQRASKSDRWAHTLVAAADAMDAQAQRIASQDALIDQFQRKNVRLLEQCGEANAIVNDVCGALDCGDPASLLPRIAALQDIAKGHMAQATARAEALEQALRDEVPVIVRRAVENYCTHPAVEGQERCYCDDIVDEAERELSALLARPEADRKEQE